MTYRAVSSETGRTIATGATLADVVRAVYGTKFTGDLMWDGTIIMNVRDGRYYAEESGQDMTDMVDNFISRNATADVTSEDTNGKGKLDNNVQFNDTPETTVTSASETRENAGRESGYLSVDSILDETVNDRSIMIAVGRGATVDTIAEETGMSVASVADGLRSAVKAMNARMDG